MIRLKNVEMEYDNGTKAIGGTLRLRQVHHH